MSEVNLAILGSGKGTNAEAIIGAAEAGVLDANIALVISDVTDAGILSVARRNKVPAADISAFKGQAARDNEIARLLDENQIDIAAMAGFNRIVGQIVIRSLGGHILNIHPAPIEQFGGPNMYGDTVFEAVLESREKVAGPMVHIATAEVDRGSVLAYEPVDVLSHDTVESLKFRTQAAEHKIYPLAIQAYIDANFR